MFAVTTAVVGVLPLSHTWECSIPKLRSIRGIWLVIQHVQDPGINSEFFL